MSFPAFYRRVCNECIIAIFFAIAMAGNRWRGRKQCLPAYLEGFFPQVLLAKGQGLQ
jgi:hypothetical protein